MRRPSCAKTAEMRHIRIDKQWPTTREHEKCENEAMRAHESEKSAHGPISQSVHHRMRCAAVHEWGIRDGDDILHSISIIWKINLQLLLARTMRMKWQLFKRISLETDFGTRPKTDWAIVSSRINPRTFSLPIRRNRHKLCAYYERVWSWHQFLSNQRK